MPEIRDPEVFGATPTTGWTTEAFIEHTNALREADRQLSDERIAHIMALRDADDRRYTEVADQRAAALTIGKTADDKALNLARELQAYKDDKADKMRDQNMSASGTYVTRDDLANVMDTLRLDLKPLFEYMTSTQGVAQGVQMTTGRLFAYIAAGGTIMAILSGVITFIISATTHTI